METIGTLKKKKKKGGKRKEMGTNLVRMRDENLRILEDKWWVASPQLHRSSSAVTTQRAKDCDGGDFEREGRGKINSEKQKSAEEGKTSTFIKPLKN